MSFLHPWTPDELPDQERLQLMSEMLSVCQNENCEHPFCPEHYPLEDCNGNDQ